MDDFFLEGPEFIVSKYIFEDRLRLIRQMSIAWVFHNSLFYQIDLSTGQKSRFRFFVMYIMDSPIRLKKMKVQENVQVSLSFF